MDNENKYPDYFYDYFNEEENKPQQRNYNRNQPAQNRPVRSRNQKPYSKRNPYGRKGLKWKLLAIIDNKYFFPVTAAILVLILIFSVVSCTRSCGNNAQVVTTAPSTTVQPTTIDESTYQITGVPVMFQDEYKACCESYACTMLMQYLGFDLEIGEFVNNYLFVKELEYGEDGNIYGPDLDAAFAGDLQFGYGINAPGMAKCMNNYLKDQNSTLKATPLKGVSLDDLCKTYVRKDIPVMIWATANLQEPFVKRSWIINYVDENSTKKVGDTMEWLMHEHCMVLIGYDNDNYYMCDSVEGKVSVFPKEPFEDLYNQLGTQAIVVQQYKLSITIKFKTQKLRDYLKRDSPYCFKYYYA